MDSLSFTAVLFSQETKTRDSRPRVQTEFLRASYGKKHKADIYCLTEFAEGPEIMSFDPLATPCLLYCGSCLYYMVKECRGCGSEDRQGCEIFDCCRKVRKLRFCTECDDFPCVGLKRSVGADRRWLEEQAALLRKKRVDTNPSGDPV